jgi:hypothetical protein
MIGKPQLLAGTFFGWANFFYFLAAGPVLAGPILLEGYYGWAWDNPNILPSKNFFCFGLAIICQVNFFKMLTVPKMASAGPAICRV